MGRARRKRIREHKDKKSRKIIEAPRRVNDHRKIKEPRCQSFTNKVMSHVHSPYHALTITTFGFDDKLDMEHEELKRRMEAFFLQLLDSPSFNSLRQR